MRGNGQIIQELEAVFRGAGWNVIKCIWGSDWDPLLRARHRRPARAAAGRDRRRPVPEVLGRESGAYIREHLFGTDPRLLELVKHLSDEELQKLRLGGHDPAKVYAAYKAAVEHTGPADRRPCADGQGLRPGRSRRRQEHHAPAEEAERGRAAGIPRALRHRPISDEQLHTSPFYRPPDDSPEMQYLQSRRKALGGLRAVAHADRTARITEDLEPIFEEFYAGTDERKASTTMVFVQMLAKMLRDKEIGKLVVPIVPDEARTFGMEALFRQVGIYSHVGQLYEPVDSDTLLYYKEAKDGQILEEGITEAGSMSSFIAAGTAYATHGVNTIPFFIYYSMFGFQRIGDLIWAAADARCRGFLLGGTAGRTTLAGEGLQHQDGHSHVLSLPVPNCLSYDPAFAYELAVIIQDGIRRMYGDGESIFYYLTVMNEQYEMPAMPEGVDAKASSRGCTGSEPTAKPKAQAARAAPRQRRDPARGGQGAGDPRGEVQRRRRRLERHQLQRALSRRPRGRALEPAAPRRDAESAVRDAGRWPMRQASSSRPPTT